MTRKDYVLLAETLRGARTLNDEAAAQTRNWTHFFVDLIANDFARKLAADNPRFDSAHFLAVVRGEKPLDSKPPRPEERVFICENGCTPRDMYGNPVDTPFYYGADVCSLVCGREEGEEFELGVLAYPDAQPSNRWTDGVAGIPAELADGLREYSELPNCLECGGQVIGVSAAKAETLRHEHDKAKQTAQ